MPFSMQEQFSRQIDTIRIEQQIETSSEGFGGGFFPNDWLNGEKRVQHFFVKRGFGKMVHEVDENTLMELAGFVGHLTEDAIDGVEIVATSELFEKGGVGGVVVLKTLLFRYHVEYFQCVLRILLAFD